MRPYSAATDFALSLPTSQVHLTAIHPEKTEINRWGREQPIIRGHSFDRLDVDGIEQWIARAQRREFGLYFNFNDLSKPLSKFHPKAHEGDVSVLHCLHVDADDPKDVTDPEMFNAVHAALLKHIRQYPLQPSLIIDSGNGFGLFWSIRPAIIVTDENRLDLKSRNKALREWFDADPCENLDRVMRLPGTTNFPSAVKIKRGRKPALARIVQDHRQEILDGYPLSEFPLSAEPPIPTSHSGDAYKAIGEPEIADVNELVRSKAFHVLDVDLQKLILTENVTVGERSEAVFRVCCELRRHGWSDGEILAIITDPALAISAHIMDQKQRANVEQASRMIVAMNNMGVKTVAEEFADAEEI